MSPPDRSSIDPRMVSTLLSILDDTPELIAALDPNFRFLAFNRAFHEEFSRIFGGDVAIGTSLVDALAHLPDERAKAVELWGRALAGEAFTVLQAFGDPARQRNIYEIVYRPIRDAVGRITGAHHVVRDVTARVRAEEAAASLNAELERRVEERTAQVTEEEERLRRVVRHSRCILWSADIERNTGQSDWPDRYVWRQQVEDEAAAQEVLPLDTAEASYATAWDWARNPEDGARMHDYADRALDEGWDHYAQEFRCNDRDGRERWLYEDVTLQSTGEGRWKAYGVTTDVTARKEAEEALRKSEERFRTLAENSPEVITRLDRQLRHTYINAYGANVYGTAQDQVIGKTNAELGMPAEMITYWNEHFERVFASGEQQTVDFEFDSRRLGHRHFSSLFVPERDETGEVASVLAITRDVTEAVQARERLQESEARLSQMVAHAPCILWDAYIERNPAVRGGWEWLSVVLDEKAAQAIFPLDIPPRKTYAGAWYESVPLDDRERLDHNAIEALRNETPHYEQEFRCTSRDGEIRWMREAINLRRVDADHWRGYAVTLDITERKRVETALARGNAQFRALIENVHAGVALIDETGRFSLVNRRFLDLFGLPSDTDLLNVNDQDWGRWEVCDENGRRLDIDDHPVRRAARSGERVVDQLCGVRRPSDGALLWMTVSAEPLKRPDGAIEGVICTYQDLSERRRVEAALRESEERFRSVVENLSEGLMLFDSEQNMIYQNPASRRIHQFSETEILRLDRDQDAPTWRSWDENGDLIPFGGWPIERVFRGERFQDQILRVQRLETGHTFDASYNGCPVYGPDGSLRFGFITIRDITHERRIQTALADREEWLRQAVRSARCILWQATIAFDAETPSGAIWYQTLVDEDAAQAVLPLDIEPYGTYIKAWVASVHPEDRKRLDTTAFAWMTPGDHRYEHEFRCTDRFGAEHWIGEQVVMHELGEGRWQGFGVAVDITERKRVEAELREADRRKDEFLAMLAHELRNPLAPILTAANVLQLRGPDDPRLNRSREIIIRQVHHMARLLEDLLDVARITRKKIALRKGSTDLKEVIARAIEASRPTIEGRGHHLSTKVSPEPLFLEGDSTRLEQVLVNLLGNAAKYTPAGGRIAVIAERNGDEGVLRVRDSGEGIDPELLPHLFEPFTQGTRSLDRSQGGLGLGLSLVKGLVEGHGGRVEAHSDGPGMGSEFVVRLPLRSPEPVTVPPPTEPAVGAVNPRRVLLVEDNPDAVETLVTLLSLDGHEVQVAPDGPSALETAETSPPEVVLLDIGLPGLDGYEVARRLRERFGPGETILIALTGYGSDEDRQRAREAGFDHHLTKPVDYEELRRVLAAVV